MSLGSLGESKAEQSDDVSIGGLGLHECLNERVPLLDHGACLVSGDVHAGEVGVAVEALDLVDLELERSPRLGLGLVVAVSQGSGENTTSEAVSGLLLTGGLVAGGESDASLIEAWSKHVVPFFLEEWVGTIQGLARHNKKARHLGFPTII